MSRSPYSFASLAVAGRRNAAAKAALGSALKRVRLPPADEDSGEVTRPASASPSGSPPTPASAGEGS